MDKNKIRKEIIGLIDSIKEQSGSLSGDDPIPPLQLQPLLHKIGKLQERAVVFNYLNSLPSNDELAPDLFTPVALPATQLTQTPVPSAPIPSAPAFKPELKEKTVAGKFRQKRIESIKAAIGINEKFRYINDMFEGSAPEYHAAVAQLDNMMFIDEALVYIDSLRHIYKWKPEEETVIAFMDLVNRRFAP